MGDVIFSLWYDRITRRMRACVTHKLSVQASVPLSEMFGYATAFKFIIHKESAVTTQWKCDHYEQVPKSISR